MPQFPLLLIEGLIAGLVVATASFFFYSRTQRTSATRTLETARQEAQALIAALQRHLMRLHKARGALDQGASMETILRQQWPPLNFKQQPVFSAQCRAWSLASLTTALRLTADAALAARLKSDLEEPLAERLMLNIAYLARSGARAPGGSRR